MYTDRRWRGFLGIFFFAGVGTLLYALAYSGTDSSAALAQRNVVFALGSLFVIASSAWFIIMKRVAQERQPRFSMIVFLLFMFSIVCIGLYAKISCDDLGGVFRVFGYGNPGCYLSGARII